MKNSRVVAANENEVAMELHGSLGDNLKAALQSAKRLRGTQVHAETLAFWHQLLDHARRQARRGGVPQQTADLIRELSLELAEHYIRQPGES